VPFLDFGSPATAVDLTGINHLSLLRYLKVIGGGRKGMVLLPSEIGGMRLLETWDISGLLSIGSGQALEIVVDDMRRLSHVSVPLYEGIRLPDGIGKAKSLVTLDGFSLAEESISGLGELTALSELILSGVGGRLDLDKMPYLWTLKVIAALITSFEKLGNLRAIELWRNNGGTVYSGDAMLGPSFSPRFRKIERLDLDLLIFSVVPRWICRLCSLRVLGLGAKQIHQEDFNVIGTELTSLANIWLQISRVPGIQGSPSVLVRL
jgi:hypothetical protein